MLCDLHNLSVSLALQPRLVELTFVAKPRILAHLLLGSLLNSDDTTPLIRVPNISPLLFRSTHALSSNLGSALVYAVTTGAGGGLM